MYDAAGLRALEIAAIETLDGDAGILMARAGLAAWHTVLAHWPDTQRIVVVCGPGNNGGDGYVFARHVLVSGRAVRVCRHATHAPRTALAQAAYEAFVASGGQVEEVEAQLPDADLVVDALFGIGLSRAPDAAAIALIEAMHATRAPILALDVPSGLDADRGSAPGAAIRAARTLQYLGPHIGLQTGNGPDHAGVLSGADLDVPAALRSAIAPAARRVDIDDLGQWLRPRARHAHKGSSGHVLLVGGDAGTGGAVLLAAEAALRTGAGLVSVATRGTHIGPLLARCPEAMGVDAHDTAAFTRLLARSDVVAIGPGLGQGAWAHSLQAEVLASTRPLVLDADALNLLAQSPLTLSADTILTPHPGEAARLLGTSSVEIQRDRPAAVRALTARYGCVVVLKGAGTLVCAPGGVPWLVAAGNPGMAVGGMGDALTGCIAALRAQGLDSEQAAVCGALLHGAAGDRAARDGGERGLLPTDLIAALRPLANPERPA